MIINVEKVGGLSGGKNLDPEPLELPEGAMIRDAMKKLKFSRANIRFLVTFCNDVEVRAKHKLKDGDNLKILLMIGGGK